MLSHASLLTSGYFSTGGYSGGGGGGGGGGVEIIFTINFHHIWCC